MPSKALSTNFDDLTFLKNFNEFKIKFEVIDPLDEWKALKKFQVETGEKLKSCVLISE